MLGKWGGGGGGDFGGGGGGGGGGTFVGWGSELGKKNIRRGCSLGRWRI